jgi:hypothetical protein
MELIKAQIYYKNKSKNYDKTNAQNMPEAALQRFIS